MTDTTLASPATPAPAYTPTAYAHPPIIRSYCLSVDAFDHLKTMKRVYERRDGVSLSNSQALDLLIQDHERQHFAVA
mgnify:CR=1 FL=1